MLKGIQRTKPSVKCHCIALRVHQIELLPEKRPFFMKQKAAEVCTEAQQGISGAAAAVLLQWCLGMQCTVVVLTILTIIPFFQACQKTRQTKEVPISF